MKARKCIAAAICLLISLKAWSLDEAAILAAASAFEGSTPRVVGSSILFTYSFGEDIEGRLHTVQIAFEHEAFRAQHSFQRNAQGVYVCLLPIPDEVDQLTYRLVIDGIWTVDPANPVTVTDRWGVSLSRFELPQITRPPTSYPVVEPGGNVKFVLTTNPGSAVSLVGSFNGWDPFLTPMVEVEPGEFERELPLGPGEYLYYFLVDGRRIPDPLNRNQRRHSSGQLVSSVVLPR